MSLLKNTEKRLSKKLLVILIPLLPEGGVSEGRGGRIKRGSSYLIVDDRLMYLPTTSPYGYSSFLKEENEDRTDFLGSLLILLGHVEIFR